MNIPNDGGWGKSAGTEATPQPSHGNGLPKARQSFWGTLPKDWLLLGCLILACTFSFGLGFLAAHENNSPKDPLWIEQLPLEELPGSISSATQAAQPAALAPPSTQTTAATAASAPMAAQTGNYVASKTGKKYYLPDCMGAKRIKDGNKVWFATKEGALAAGYQPATNCKGL